VLAFLGVAVALENAFCIVIACSLNDSSAVIVNIIQGYAGINPSDREVIAILLIKLTHYGYDARC
jgi:hypothetical protein